MFSSTGFSCLIISVVQHETYDWPSYLCFLSCGFLLLKLECAFFCQFIFHKMIYPYNIQSVASVVFSVIFSGICKTLFLHLVLLKKKIREEEGKSLEFQAPTWSFLTWKSFVWASSTTPFSSKHLSAFCKDCSVRHEVFPQDRSLVCSSNSLTLPFVITLTKTLTARSLVYYSHYPSTE